MNILVYEGNGVSNSCLAHLLLSLKACCSLYDVKTISSESLRKDPWGGNCSCLFIPGGRDVPYLRDWDYPGYSSISDYVNSGGRVFGICAGAYASCGTVDWQGNDQCWVSRDCHSNRLTYKDGPEAKIKSESLPPNLPYLMPRVTAKGTLASKYPGFESLPPFEYNSESGATFLPIKSHLIPDHFNPMKFYYNGGCSFIGLDTDGGNDMTKILAFYTNANGTDYPAIIQVKRGLGIITALGFHPEMFLFMDEHMIPNVEGRRLFWQLLLQSAGIKCGLTVTPASDITDFKPFTVYHSWSLNLKRYSSNQYEFMSDWPAKGSSSFDWSFFQQNLHSVSIPLFYAPVLDSTQTFLSKIMDSEVLGVESFPFALCLADHQVSGMGRGKNKWISTPNHGSLLFSMLMEFPSNILQSLSFLQYMVAITLYKSISKFLQSRFGIHYGIALKWPNDLYAHFRLKNEWRKISGILCQSFYDQDDYGNRRVRVIVGIGVNLLQDSSELSSLYGFIRESRQGNLRQDLDAEKGNWRELILASFVNEWTSMIQGLKFIASNQNPSMLKTFIQSIIEEYQMYWMHQDQMVTVTVNNGDDDRSGTIPCVIKSVDPNDGYLICETFKSSDIAREGLQGISCFGAHSKTSRIIKVEPDGNSFDMSRNLIYRKKL